MFDRCSRAIENVIERYKKRGSLKNIIRSGRLINLADSQSRTRHMILKEIR